MAIKEAAKQCTKWGLAGGPDAKKPDPAWGGTGRMAIKEAAKRCTKCGLAGGPDAKKM
jgi:hypothetical protein